MMSGRRDIEPLIVAPGWINDEVRKGFMKDLNRAIVALEDKERLK